MKLAEYVQKNTARGACTCGQCIDAGPEPEKHQPDGHTADLIFFKVAKTEEANADDFRALVESEHPRWLDGEEHNYLDLGAELGDQGIALVTMGLGHLLEVWELLTPANLLPFLPREYQLEFAGRGMITIKAKAE